MKQLKIASILAIAAVVVGLTVTSAAVGRAATNPANTGPMGNLINAIANKFNLQAGDVKQVFDEQHAQMEAAHEQQYKDFLSQAVKDGKLTQTQADQIIAKKQEIEAQRQINIAALQGKTPSERHAAMQTQMQALQQWTKDNNIPAEYLRFGLGKRHGFGHHGIGSDFDQTSQPPSTQPSTN